MMVFAIGVVGTALTDVSARADLLDEIKSRGELIAGTEARYPPFEFVKEGKIVGLSADMMEIIMQDLPGVKLTRLDLPWQGILPGLEAKKFDYVITAVTVTKPRMKRYALSLPIADATQALVKRKGDDRINKPEDVEGLVIGSQIGSAPLEALKSFDERLKAAGGEGIKEIKTYVDYNEAYADLAAGRVDAVNNGLPNLQYLAQERPDVFEVVLPTFGPKKYFAWAARNDEDSASLVAFFNDEIRKLNKSGKLEELTIEWLGSYVELPADKTPEPAE
jgi:polar amino acid transport system substrate-binding protein